MCQAKVCHKVIPCPTRSTDLPGDIHWLSGEGCGSWFHIEKLEADFIISRFSPEGKLECKGIFNQILGDEIKLNQKYEFTYLSHCAEVNIIQNNINLKFKLITKYNENSSNRNYSNGLNCPV